MDIYAVMREEECKSLNPKDRYRIVETIDISEDGQFCRLATSQRSKSCQSYLNRHSIPLGSMKLTDSGAFLQNKTYCMKSFQTIYVPD